MYEDVTPESIETAILSKITEFDTREGSFARTLVAPAAYELWKYYTALEGVPDMLFVSDQSGSYIDKKAADFGILRKAGVNASAVVSFTGTAGTILPAGKAFLTEDGLLYLLEGQVTLSAEGSGSGVLLAAEAGAKYNVSAGEIKLQQSPLSGLTAFSAGAASGGVDPETDAQLVERYYEYLQRPATSGNVYQYEQWAKSVSGVGKAKVFPLWNGAGTVKVVICSEGYGTAPAETVSACASYIESVRPIGASVTVESASALSLTVSAAVKVTAATTLTAVKAAFEKELTDYLRSLAFEKAEVVYARVGFLLLDIEGVTDYSDLLLNGKAQNVTIGDTQIPSLSEVTLRAGT